MKVTKMLAAAFAGLLAAALTIIGPPAASAVPAVHPFGSQFVTGPPGEVMEYTVRDLRLSHDVIPAGVAGRLFEATVTARSLEGSPQVLVPAFHARAGNGDNYGSLWPVDAPHAIHGGHLAAGDETTGKLYFDVVHADPDSVTYRNPADDMFIWKN